MILISAWIRSISSSLSLENSASSHTCTNTHGNDSVLAIDPLQLMEHRGDHTSTSGSQWMTKGNGTSTLIQLAIWNAKFLNTVSGLTGEGLVHLPHVNFWNSEASLLQGLGDCDSWADTHDLWGHTSGSVTQESTFDG